MNIEETLRGSNLGLYLVLGLAVLICLAGLRNSLRSRRLWRDASVVQGEILERRVQVNRAHTFKVLVRFQPHGSAEPLTGWSQNVLDIASSPQVGTTVRVGYNAARPEYFEVKPPADKSRPADVRWVLASVAIMGLALAMVLATWL